MEAKELNEKAVTQMKSLTDHEYFNNLTMYDQEIADNQDPFNKGFYMSIQDKISLVNGEFITAYYSLRAELKTYIAVRKSQIILQKTANDEKVPGNEILESMILAEVPELNSAVIVLEGWTVRADSSLKTARNHTYETKEVVKGQD